MLIKGLVILAVGAWLVLGMLFPAYPTLRRLKAEGAKIGWVLKVPIYLSLLVGVLADILFNAIWGTIIFRELPKEWLFTDRLKRHWRGVSFVQRQRASPWVRRVNLIDPGHV